MQFNGIQQLTRDAEGTNPYVLLVRYGPGEMEVAHRGPSASEVLAWAAKDGSGFPMALVKIVDLAEEATGVAVEVAQDTQRLLSRVEALEQRVEALEVILRLCPNLPGATKEESRES